MKSRYPIKIEQLSAAIAASEAVRREIKNLTDLEESNKEAKNIVIGRVQEITSNLNESASSLADAKISLEVTLEQRKQAIACENSIKVHDCNQEVKRLTFDTAQKAAIFERRESLSETQLLALDAMTDKVISAAYKTGCNQSFRGIVADSALKNIERASLEDKYAFTFVLEEMEQRLNDFKINHDEKQEVFEESEDF